jgi:hypothetical protein
VTLFVGAAYGIVLQNIKAMLILGFATSLVSVLTLLLTIIVFDQFGIRVGTGNFAMSKVTVASLLTSAMSGGASLGGLLRKSLGKLLVHSRRRLELVDPAGLQFKFVCE